MTEHTVTVTIQADSATEAKDIVERGIDKQGLAVLDIKAEKNLVVTIWNEQGDDTILFAELDRYEVVTYDGNETIAMYVGTLRADNLTETDPKILEYVERTINVHLPL